MEPNPDKVYNLTVKEDYEEFYKLCPTAYSFKYYKALYEFYYTSLFTFDKKDVFQIAGSNYFYVGTYRGSTNLYELLSGKEFDSNPLVVQYKNQMKAEQPKYETKTLPSGIVVENKLNSNQKYCWWIKDKPILHNEGEPAVEYNNGNKYWYQHGEKHRLDGPAIEYANGYEEYYINNKRFLKEEDYWKHPEVIAYKERQNNMEYETKTLPSGIVIQNKPQRYNNQVCRWTVRSSSTTNSEILHNEGGPAIEWKNGSYHYYCNNLYHRLDGPAVKNLDSYQFFINGCIYAEKDYWKHPDVISYKEKINKENNDVLDICIKENYDLISNKFPDIHDEYKLIKESYKYAYVSLVDGLEHKLDGPSCETHNNEKQFLINGRLYLEAGYWNTPEVIAFQKNSQLFSQQPNSEATTLQNSNQSQIINSTKENKMSKKPLMEMFKEDTVDGAYRSASNQITKGTKAAILSQLSKNTSSEGIAAVSNLLDTEMGGAVMSMLIGMGLTYAPGISEDPRAARLAKEFRVSGISVGIDQLVNVAANTLMPAFQEAMKSLPSVEVAVKPAKTNKRIKVKEVTEEDEEEDTELKTSKAAR